MIQRVNATKYNKQIEIFHTFKQDWQFSNLDVRNVLKT